MSLRPIIILPDKRLRLISQAVEAADDDIRNLLDDMLETMYEAPGIGLAAIQIAVPKRVIVVDVAPRSESENAEGGEPVAKKNPVCLINPEILWTSDERSVYDEGCLSIPEFYADVERPARVKVGYLDRMGERQELDADGLLATCLQHEIDHLNGVLFIDHISRLKRERVVKKFEKDARRRAEGEEIPAGPARMGG